MTHHRRFAALASCAVLLLPAGCSSGSGTVPVGASRDRTTTVATRTTATDVRTISSEQRIDGLVLDERPTVWARLPAAFDTLGVEVTYSDPRAFVMGSRRFRVRRIDGERPAEWIDCGMGPTARPYANQYEVTMGLTVQLVEVPEGTQARVRLEAAAKPRDVSGGSLPCSSKGTLERRILTLISH